LRVLFVGYLVAALAIIALGATSNVQLLVYGLSFSIGFLILGGHICNVGVVASMYPAAIRTTGVGWAQGIGRIGAIIGPAAIGGALALHWSALQIFGATSVFSLIAAITVHALSRLDNSPQLIRAHSVVSAGVTGADV
jgi:AAHS family 4-hydroxybenzoate transporter-like MFS transporter